MPELTKATTDDDTTDCCRAFVHHGVELEERGRQLYGDCPLCGAGGKLTVASESGLWRCFVCGRSGNPLEFLRHLHAASVTGSAGWYGELAKDRGVSAATVEAWGCCRSAVDGCWMVPGYSVRGELAQLYRRVEVQDEDGGAWRKVLLPTPGVWPDGRAHALHMPVGDYDQDRQVMWFAEGPWDGMALWGAARSCGQLADANIVAVPGCTTWQDAWTEACRGRDVVLPYDNDHPHDRSGTVTMAGRDGVRRICGKLAGVARSVSWVEWGGGGYDATLPDGFDVRDALTRRISRCRN